MAEVEPAAAVPTEADNNDDDEKEDSVYSDPNGKFLEV